MHLPLVNNFMGSRVPQFRVLRTFFPLQVHVSCGKVRIMLKASRPAWSLIVTKRPRDLLSYPPFWGLMGIALSFNS